MPVKLPALFSICDMLTWMDSLISGGTGCGMTFTSDAPSDMVILDSDSIGMHRIYPPPSTFSMLPPFSLSISRSELVVFKPIQGLSKMTLKPLQGPHLGTMWQRSCEYFFQCSIPALRKPRYMTAALESQGSSAKCADRPLRRFGRTPCVGLATILCGGLHAKHTPHRLF